MLLSQSFRAVKENGGRLISLFVVDGKDIFVTYAQ